MATVQHVPEVQQDVLDGVVAAAFPDVPDGVVEDGRAFHVEEERLAAVNLLEMPWLGEDLEYGAVRKDASVLATVNLH